MGKVFRKYGADNDRIWMLVAAACTILLTLAVFLHPLMPHALDYVLAALLAAALIALIALLKARAAMGWCAALALPIALSRLLDFPWSSVAAALVLIAFLLLCYQRIDDALLPVRAYFIRRKAGRQ